METTIDYKLMLDIVQNANYKGFIGVEYEGDTMSEEQGILATKKLILEMTKNFA
jgi:hydroxypyruvate isomerase